MEKCRLLSSSNCSPHYSSPNSFSQQHEGTSSDVLIKVAMKRMKIIAVDTTLGTHLLLSASRDTRISELRDTIKEEHLSCFPGHGIINICALMLEYNCTQYHIPDSLLVHQVFRKSLSKVYAEVYAAVPGTSSPQKDFKPAHTGNLVEKVGGENFHVTSDVPLVKCPEAVRSAGCHIFSGGKRESSKKMADYCTGVSLCHTKTKGDIGLDSLCQINGMPDHKIWTAQENLGCPLPYRILTELEYKVLSAALGSLDRGMADRAAACQKREEKTQKVSKLSEKVQDMADSHAERQEEKSSQLKDEAAFYSQETQLCCMKAEGAADEDNSLLKVFAEGKEILSCRKEADETAYSSAKHSNSKKHHAECNSDCSHNSTGPREADGGMVDGEMGLLPTEANATLQILEGPKLQNVYFEPNYIGMVDREMGRLPMVANGALQSFEDPKLQDVYFEPNYEPISRECYSTERADKGRSRKEHFSSSPLNLKSIEGRDEAIMSQNNSQILSKKGSLCLVNSKASSSKQEGFKCGAEDLQLNKSLCVPKRSNSHLRNDVTSACDNKTSLNDGPVAGNADSLQGDATEELYMDDSSGHFFKRKGSNALAPASIYADMVPDTQESQTSTPIFASSVKDVKISVTGNTAKRANGKPDKSTKEANANALRRFLENLGPIVEKNASVSTTVFDCQEIQPFNTGLIENHTLPKKCKKQKTRVGHQKTLQVEDNCNLAIGDVEKKEDNQDHRVLIEIHRKNYEDNLIINNKCTLDHGRNTEISCHVQEQFLEEKDIRVGPSGKGYDCPQTRSSEEEENNLSGQGTNPVLMGGYKASTRFPIDCRDKTVTSPSANRTGRKPVREEGQCFETSGSIGQVIREREGIIHGGCTGMSMTQKNYDQVASQKHCTDGKEILDMGLEKVVNKKKRRKKKKDDIDFCDHNNTRVEGRLSKFEGAQVDECANNCSRRKFRKILDDAKMLSDIENVEVKSGEHEQNTGGTCHVDKESIVTVKDVCLIKEKSNCDVLKFKSSRTRNSVQNCPHIAGRKNDKTARKLDGLCSNPAGRVLKHDVLNLTNNSTSKIRIKEQGRKSSNPRRWIQLLLDKLTQSKNLAIESSRESLSDSVVRETTKEGDCLKEILINGGLSLKAVNNGGETRQKSGPSTVGAEKIACPVGCGRLFTRKSSTWYRHKQECPGRSL